MANSTKNDGDEKATQEESAKAKAPQTEPKASEALSAPTLESPESPAAPPVQTKSEAPALESPEAPVSPPAEVVLFGDVQSGGIRSGGSGLATYVNANAAGSASTTTGIDTGVGSAPFDRPSTFAPPGSTATIVAPNDLIDLGTSTQMANRANTFDLAQTMTVFVDPGAF